jgi:hypothetical protein
MPAEDVTQAMFVGSLFDTYHSGGFIVWWYWYWDFAWPGLALRRAPSPILSLLVGLPL